MLCRSYAPQSARHLPATTRRECARSPQLFRSASASVLRPQVQCDSNLTISAAQRLVKAALFDASIALSVVHSTPSPVLECRVAALAGQVTSSSACTPLRSALSRCLQGRQPLECRTLWMCVSTLGTGCQARTRIFEAFQADRVLLLWTCR